ncbi:hypothetical protein [uncultured Dysosmobacter sp.]|uniref:hypothetical protein n=1 Tax=uncultured Dysosmobacter sp. TaxID=2591384 RepID=UPI00263373B9|nr:hypothetical protein [uncultured Dysosmobacter sp.]
MKKTEGARKLWDRYKCAALVVLVGVGLLLWPDGSGDTGPSWKEQEMRDIQTEIAEILGSMSGVGQVKVMLTLESDGQRQLAQDTELTYSGDTKAPADYSRRSETVLVDGGSGDQVVVIQNQYPTYRGALVVCQGGGRAEVKLAVTEAVAALTGLSAGRITVAEWQ